jgi:hypothetical protein
MVGSNSDVTCPRHTVQSVKSEPQALHMRRSIPAHWLAGHFLLQARRRRVARLSAERRKRQADDGGAPQLSRTITYNWLRVLPCRGGFVRSDSILSF